ncbi:AAA family ATPase [Chitinophaga nivalis]|uniref:AAA family ATPase n=1 Tax=Chitinophaga nivalis TaxID=2991709 RepID=A0ABT3IPP0_9BACT|nr:AAA family ATPase [Chitinophaga nivalis]MCW3464406.1 AAA family ATPase [Chitinophaga nivalis]MCW3485903.1 AAA family ATPase [Chitinophaga nivalis]
MMKTNAYVFTGGPGAGKTTVIRELAQLGYATVPESGRHIIQEQVRTGGNALPWADEKAFRDLMLQAAIADFEALPSAGAPVFLDRGIPDVIGYTKLIGLPPEALVIPPYRYNPRVFIFPAWEDIFCADTERKQDFATAIRTYEVMVSVYTAAGYELVTVPALPAMERVAFIIARV